MILLAIIWSIFCTFNAVASAKPPKNKKIVGSAKATRASRLSANPNRTDRIGTNNAVMVTLTASVSHRMATNASKDNPLFSAGAKGSVLSRIKKRATSERNIIVCLFHAFR